MATFAAQKGIQGADSIDIFRSALDDYYVMAQSGGFKNADKQELANRLYALAEMALQFSEKEEEPQERPLTPEEERRQKWYEKWC